MLALKSVSVTRLGQPLVGPIDLTVAPGSIAVIMGPSGAGKSTLLNAVLGNLDPAFSMEGEIWLNGTRRDQLAIENRRIGILFQDDLLFPHLTVGQNLAFAIPQGPDRAERRRRVDAALASAGLEGLENRDPATLSGGQKARVSLMRALLGEPEALLLDEPFSKLDAALRDRFSAMVRGEIAARAIPALLVTHDPRDILEGDRVLTLPSGERPHV